MRKVRVPGLAASAALTASAGKRLAGVSAAAVLLLAGGVGLSGLFASTAALAATTTATVAERAAASLPSNCAQASVGADVVCTFGYTGAEQTFTVPAGVTSVTLTATGASGGTDHGGTPGRGGVATVSAAVSSGEALYVEVGGQGASNTSSSQSGQPGGFNGGGTGGTGGAAESSLPAGLGGGGGGGASDVRTLPASDGLSPTDSRLVVGGGGGGGCDISAGGNAGGPGGAIYDGTQGGGAGTLTGGGAGGNGEGDGSGVNGILGAGGAGGTVVSSLAPGENGGCGGGGGYYGGGGGSLEASGGGGSSYAPGGTTGIATSAGDGSVTISYAPPGPAVGLVLSPATATIPLGGSQTYAAATIDAGGATLADVTSATSFLASGGGSCAGAVCTPTGAGSYQVTGMDGSLSGSADLTESQGSAGVSLSASPASGATTASAVSVSASVVGVAGAPDPTGSVTFSVSGVAGVTASCGGGSATVPVSDGSATCALGSLPAGTYDFGASYSGDSNYLTGSAGSVTGYAVSLVPTQASVTSSVSSPVFGQPVSFTATVSDSASLPVGGSVQWLVDGSDSGAPVPVNSSGAATLGPLSSLSVGTHTIEADYSGSATLAASSFQTMVVVGPAATATSVSVAASALTATVTTQSPGSGTPTGTVSFEVNGSPVGSAPLVASATAGTATATLDYASSGAETVAASYGGGTDFQQSSGSTATTNPVITATVTSKYPESSFGWYRSPVTVTFTCTAGSAPLSAPCPGPVTLTSNGAAQSVSETITDTDGGMATVSVSPINIDQVPPVVRVTGARNGGTYEAPGPKLTCTASDTLSGLAGPCTLTVKQSESAVSWTATATDKAGNTATVSGKIKLIDFYIKGAAVKDGRFVVTVGHTYTVVAYLLTGTKAPRYVDAAPAGVRPHPVGSKMTSVGGHLWEIRASITTTMDRKYEDWNLGILTGKVMHIVQILLRK